MIAEFATEAAAALHNRFWRPHFFTAATRVLAEKCWLTHFRDEAESLLYFRERAADAMRAKNKQRQELAVKMAEHLSGPVAALCEQFGPELVINGLLDMTCGLTATSFPERDLKGIFQSMAIRVHDTDFMRHKARFAAAAKKRPLHSVRRTPSGIILPG